MKFTRIQDSETKEIIQHRINDLIVCKHVYRSEYDNWMCLHKGAYNVSTTTRTKRNNFKHTCYVSI
jgi:hypothetical protein